MKLKLLFLSAALFCCCRPVYVEMTSNVFEQERAFLVSVLERDEFEEMGLRLALTPEKKKASSIFIDFFSSWEYEEAIGDILISKTYLVPRVDPLDGRTDTTFAACLENSEDLVLPREIAPPFAALRVDGFALDDEGYPLIRKIEISVRANENKKTSNRIQKKIRLLEENLKAQSKPLIASAPEIFWLAAGGDTVLSRGAAEIIFKEGPVGIFGGTAEMLAESDLALVNLEGPMSRRGEKVYKSVNIRFVPETAPAIKDAGIDAVLLANNHIFDYGMDAFLDTLSNLNNAGIGIAGAGLDFEAASTPVVLTRKGKTCRIFGLASFPTERTGWDGASVAAGKDLPGMLHVKKGGREILKEKLSHGGAMDIVLFHGGIEWTNRPDAATRELYTDLISAGADLVIGSHPHVPQGFEWVQGKPVFWSLGNYVFGGMEDTPGGEQGLFIRLGYYGDHLFYIEPFALALNQARTSIDSPENLKRFYALSRALR